MNINVQNLFFSYLNELQVLQGISFNSNSLDSIVIVGASGSGKSTLLKILSGIQESKGRESGRVLIDGLKPKKFKSRNQTGFMFQKPTLMPNRTVKQNIELPLKITGKVNNDVDSLIEMVGLTKFKDYLPSELSGGMATRVSLARTFVTQPKLLLLDEPFSSLDRKWKFTLYDELEALISKYKVKTVQVTHDIEEALILSNHILVFGKSGIVLKEFNIDDELPRLEKMTVLNDLNDYFIRIQEEILNDE